MGRNLRPCRGWPGSRGASMRAKNGVAVLAILSLVVTASGCATTNRTKTLLLMTGVGAVAAGVGYSVAPRDERPEMHALYWGAAGAAVAGVAGLFLFDEQKRSEELERQATVMKKELDAFRDEGSTASHGPQLLYETNAPFGRDIPGEYQGLVRPGRWSVYKLNQWVAQGEGTLVHHDRMVKLVPPQLTPKVQTESSEGGSSESSDETKSKGGK
jgi:hypothetical protein